MGGKKSPQAKAALDEKRRIALGYSREDWQVWKNSRPFVPEKKKSDCQKWKVNEKHVKGTHAFGAASQSGLMAKVKKAKTRVSVAPRPKAASKKVTAADSEPKVTAAASSSKGCGKEGE